MRRISGSSRDVLIQPVIHSKKVHGLREIPGGTLLQEVSQPLKAGRLYRIDLLRVDAMSSLRIGYHSSSVKPVHA